MFLPYIFTFFACFLWSTKGRICSTFPSATVEVRRHFNISWVILEFNHLLDVAQGEALACSVVACRRELYVPIAFTRRRLGAGRSLRDTFFCFCHRTRRSRPPQHTFHCPPRHQPLCIRLQPQVRGKVIYTCNNQREGKGGAVQVKACAS